MLKHKSISRLVKLRKSVKARLQKLNHRIIELKPTLKDSYDDVALKELICVRSELAILRHVSIELRDIIRNFDRGVI